MFGFSLLHGPHHDAQKSINTTFPLSDDNFIFFPLGSLKSNSGAVFPMFNPVVSWFNNGFLSLLIVVKLISNESMVIEISFIFLSF